MMDKKRIEELTNEKAGIEKDIKTVEGEYDQAIQATHQKYQQVLQSMTVRLIKIEGILEEASHEQSTAST